MRFLLMDGRSSAAFALDPPDACNVGDECQNQNRSDPAVELAKDERKPGQDNRDQNCKFAVATDRGWIDVERADQHHQRKDQENVADIRAQHIAERDAWRAQQGSVDAGQQFGR